MSLGGTGLVLCKCMLVNHHYFLFCVLGNLPFICSLDKQIKTQYGASTLRREIIRQKRGREEGGQTGSSNPGLTRLHIAFQTQSKSLLVRRLCVECVCRVRTYLALSTLGNAKHELQSHTDLGSDPSSVTD